jgi:hypothetical protein
MAIDKALYQAPQGIEEDAQALMGEPDIEIEIEDPEAVRVSVGGEEILEITEGEGGPDFYANLAEEIDEAELQSLGNELLQNIKDDLDSRKDWEKSYKEGLVLLGLKYEERTEPWDGACGVSTP